jgi:hypothetical protein
MLIGVDGHRRATAHALVQRGRVGPCAVILYRAREYARCLFSNASSHAIRTASGECALFSEQRKWHRSCRITVRDSNPTQVLPKQRTDGGSLVLTTAGPIRQRAATADAPRGDSFDSLGVGTLTLPPQPRLVQDDGRFAFRLNCSSSSDLPNTAIVIDAGSHFTIVGLYRRAVTCFVTQPAGTTQLHGVLSTLVVVL